MAPVVVVWLENILPPSHISIEGGKVSVVVTSLCEKDILSVSHFKRGRGGDVVGKYPLRLTFRAREGDSGVVGKNPSRTSSEGGGCKGTPLYIFRFCLLLVFRHPVRLPLCS